MGFGAFYSKYVPLFPIYYIIAGRSGTADFYVIATREP